MKFIYSAARALSIIFSPLLMATYGYLLATTFSYLCFNPLQTRLVVALLTLIATCVIPIIAIFILYKTGFIKDPGLNERTDRTIPYILTTVCFIGIAIYYHFVKAPAWLSMFVMGGAMALISTTIINRWWKISGHATGMGGITALMFYLMYTGNSVGNIQPEFMITVIIAGLVCTSRLILQRHTLMQIAAGFANGFMWVYGFAWFLRESPIPSLN